jgi:hypothetical protein
MRVEGYLAVWDEGYDERRRLEGVKVVMWVAGASFTLDPVVGSPGLALRTTAVEFPPVRA